MAWRSLTRAWSGPARDRRVSAERRWAPAAQPQAVRPHEDVITEILPGAYDFQGKQTFRPKKKRYGRFSPTFPMGRYVSQPLTVECRTLDDIRDFLKKCRFVSDKEQFGKDDYWMPPEEFEERRKGDCDDFALWAWRQLI